MLGATGFIGRVIVRHLAAAGYDVWTTVREHSPHGGVAQSIAFDALDGQAAVDRLRECPASLIVNAAAYGVAPSHRDLALMKIVNVDLPVGLARLAASTGARLIHLGSCSEYRAETSGQPLPEDAALETTKAYGASKAQGGMLLADLAREQRIPAARLRLFNVYGPGEAAHRLLPSLVRNLSDGSRVSMSPGTQVRDWVYVGDVADTIMSIDRALAAGKIEPGDVFNVATGVGTSVADFARKVAQTLKAPEELLGFGDLPFRADDVAHIVGSPDRLFQATSHQLKTALQEGLSLSLAA